MCNVDILDDDSLWILPRHKYLFKVNITSVIGVPNTIRAHCWTVPVNGHVTVGGPDTIICPSAGASQQWAHYEYEFLPVSCTHKMARFPHVSASTHEWVLLKCAMCPPKSMKNMYIYPFTGKSFWSLWWDPYQLYTMITWIAFSDRSIDHLVRKGNKVER
jgi:hypothetical protein